VSTRRDEPTLADVQKEYPQWRCSRAVSGLYYARRSEAGAGEHAHVNGEDPLDLRDQICRAEALSQQ
jgi:hypothetical protein